MDLQILYADTLFLSNFVMNLLALSLSGGVMHLKYKRRRVLFASMFGGIYATLAVVLVFPGALHILAGILLSVLLVLIAFGNEGYGFALFLRTFALFYFSSILLGGGIEALFSLMEEGFGMRENAVFRPADAVLAIGFFVYFLMRFITYFLGGGRLAHSVSVRIVYGERSVTLPLLVDSGCKLKDPITGRGGILVSSFAVRNVFPKEVLAAAEKKNVTLPTDHKIAGRCRLFPVVGVGGERLLLAFRADGVSLLSDGGSLDAWVILYCGESKRFDGCHGLLPASLLFARDPLGKSAPVSKFFKKGGTGK